MERPWLQGSSIRNPVALLFPKLPLRKAFLMGFKRGQKGTTKKTGRMSKLLMFTFPEVPSTVHQLTPFLTSWYFQAQGKASQHQPAWQRLWRTTTFFSNKLKVSILTCSLRNCTTVFIKESGPAQFTGTQESQQQREGPKIPKCLQTFCGRFLTDKSLFYLNYTLFCTYTCVFKNALHEFETLLITNFQRKY